MFDLSQIKSEKSLKEKIKVPLDSDSLLSTTYWFLAIIACLMALGLSWDFWMYWKRTRLHGQHDHGPGEGIATVYTALSRREVICIMESESLHDSFINFHCLIKREQELHES